MKYIVFDFFSGLHGWTQGFSDEWLIVSVELNPKLPASTGPNHIHLNMDITDPQLVSELKLILARHGRTHPDLILASPPCQGFSIASCSTHWTPPPERIPKTEKAELAVRLVKRTLGMLATFNPDYWVIENPRGLLRKMPFMEPWNETRQTIWLCQYDDVRAKPTDLWSNLTMDGRWIARPMCRNYRFDDEGNIIDRHCHHEAARRGAKTGTQGFKGNALRSELPEELSREICEVVEGLMNGLSE